MLGIRVLINEQRLSFAKRSLESELAQVINIMEGHKALNLPVGHKSYRVLYQRATDAIVRYQNMQTNLGMKATDYTAIAATVPMLRELELISQGQSLKKDQPVVAIGFGVFVGGAVVTVALAMYHNLYLALTHWANVHLAVR